MNKVSISSILLGFEVKHLSFTYRFEDVLQTQDCNIILRHYGEIKRWNVLSKVVSVMVVMDSQGAVGQWINIDRIGEDLRHCK